MVAVFKTSKAARIALGATICSAACGLGFFALLAGGYSVDAAPSWLPFNFTEDETFVASGADDESTDPVEAIGAQEDEKRERLGVGAQANEELIDDKASASTTTSSTTTAPAPTTTLPPTVELAVTAPEEGQEFDEQIITFAGVAEPGSEVYVGPYKATMDEEGNWHIELTLAPGANTVTFKMILPNGSTSTTATTVYYSPPPPPSTTTTAPPAAPVAFSANQEYGSCGEEAPYDVFWGTAAEWSTVTISSPFGSASVPVNGDGHWEKQIFFANPPAHEPFTVTVSGVNGSKNFTFVYEPQPDYPVEVPFSAFQEIGVNTSDWGPYDYFSGTATPWTTVEISSEFATVYAEVNGFGEWGRKKIIFEGLPPGLEIPVTVTAENGSQTFGFVWYPPEGSAG